jgi:hypothetical protein
MIKTINVFSTVVPRLFTRQTDNTSLVFGNYRFRFNSPSRSDILLVYDDIPKNHILHTPPKNTILFTAEPQEIKTYHPNYLKQFDFVVTSQDNLKHPHITRQHTALPWMIGIYPKSVEEKLPDTPKDFNKIKYPKKQSVVTAIISSKNKTPDHKQRLLLVNALKQKLGNQMQLFGNGINKVPDKWIALAPAKYQLVIENSRHNDYWTEKLADAFLGETYPLYWGAPNISEYFSDESLTPINIYDIDGTLQLLQKCFNNDTFKKNYSHIRKAKHQILEKYNFFQTVIDFVDSLPTNHTTSKIMQFRPNKEFFLTNQLITLASIIKRTVASPSS